VPEMQKRGYKKKMAIGPILGTGGLAMLIPPSALAVLLATLANLDVGALLIAGVVPGLMLAGFYAMLILLMCTIDPNAAPAYDVDAVSWGERLRLLCFDVLPMVSVVIGVIALAALYVFQEPIFRAIGSSPSLTGRTVVWRAAIPVVLERPLIGYGYDAFWTADAPGARSTRPCG